MDNGSSSPDNGTVTENQVISLWDQIESIQNDLKLARLAINMGQLPLTATALGNAWDKLQRLKKGGAF